MTQTDSSNVEQKPTYQEELQVMGEQLLTRVKELIHEGNVRRIIIKDESGHTFMEIPLTVATVGVILAPVLAAVGAIATLVSHFTVVVERNAPPPPPAGGNSGTKGA